VIQNTAAVKEDNNTFDFIKMNISSWQNLKRNGKILANNGFNGFP
jgi:hypothetical protein